MRYTHPVTQLMILGGVQLPDMEISRIGSNCNLIGATTNYEQGKTTVKEAVSMTAEPTVNLSISDEGRNMLREMASKFEPELNDIDFGKVHP